MSSFLHALSDQDDDWMLGGFLALVNGTSLEVLDMEGPRCGWHHIAWLWSAENDTSLFECACSASWVVRDHQGEVGFVRTEDMVLEYYNLNNTELQEMMDKTTAEVGGLFRA